MKAQSAKSKKAIFIKKTIDFLLNMCIMKIERNLYYDNNNRKENGMMKNKQFDHVELEKVSPETEKKIEKFMNQTEEEFLREKEAEKK